MNLSPEQLAALDSARQRNTLITGLAGTGKTVLAREIIQRLSSREVLAVTASTGIAAFAIRGTTINSWAGIGTANASAQSLAAQLLSDPRLKKKADNILQCTALIIDEVSMISGELIDKLDVVFRTIRKSSRPFGGIRMIFLGDFLQLPPVSTPERPATFAFEAEAWKAAEIEIHTLSRVFRQEDRRFASALSSIRIGTPSPDALQLIKDRTAATDEGFAPPVRLVTHNADADRINREEMDLIESEEIVYQSSDYTDELIPDDKLLKDCPGLQFLRLKKHARVMLLCNLDQDAGLVNGTLGYVALCNSNSVDFFTDDERCFRIERFTWEIKEGDRIVASRRQIPLRLAYAVTIHKSQGMTLAKVEAHLGKCFSAGQFYVALSRVKTADGLFLKSGTAKQIITDKKALNFYTS